MQRLMRGVRGKWLAAAAIIFVYIGCGLPQASGREARTAQTVLLFPLDKPLAGDSQGAAAELSAFLAEALAAHPAYTVVVYSERLPAVQRLVVMEPDKKASTVGPFSTDSAALNRAVAIGKAVSVDLLVVGSVKRCTFLAEQRSAEVAARVEVLDGRTGKPVMGEVNVVGVGGRAAGTETAGESKIVSEAVADAGRRLIEGITGEEYERGTAVEKDGKKPRRTQKEDVVLFPFSVDQRAASDAESVGQCARDLFAMVSDGLADSESFAPITFEARLPCVQRAVREQRIGEKDALEPIDTSLSGIRRAQKLASLIGVRLAMIGSVDRYDFQEASGEAQLTATVQLIDVGTGKIEGAFMVTGRAARLPDQKAQSELAIATKATYDAAKKLLADMTSEAL